MKKFFLPLFVVLFLAGKSQTFYDSTHTAISDTSTICIPIIVSGLPLTIDNSFGLTSICLNITHPFVSELVIQLESPDGNTIYLASAIGGSGNDFINTCFSMDGIKGSIASGTPPFTGAYIPQQSLNSLNNGQDPNGIWKLCVSDTYFGDTGSVHNFSITFATNPPMDPLQPAVICTYCICQNSNDTCDLLPDMTASAMCLQQFHTEMPGELRIANATPNIGIGPIEVHGIDSCFCDTIPVPCTTICPNGSMLKHIVIQRIYQRHGSDTLLHYDRIAGSMKWHPAHGHLHLDHWGDFSLRMQTPDPDPTAWPVVGVSTKQSFCLINLDNCTNSLGYCKDTLGTTLTMANIPNAGFGLYTGCGLDQGIYPGYLDVYDQSLNAPIVLNNICDGTYYIVSITDPENNFLESNENNNWASVPVTLTMQNTPSGPASFNYSVNGSQVTFTNTSPANATYLWNFGDGKWDTTYSPSHTYSTTGTYTVSLVSLNQCYTMNSQVVAITGVGEYVHSNLNLHVYPNPISQNSVLMYYLPDNSNVLLEVTDLSGRIIETLANEKQMEGGHRIFISEKMRNLPSGAYVIHLVANEGMHAVKIMKIY